MTWVARIVQYSVPGTGSSLANLYGDLILPVNSGIDQCLQESIRRRLTLYLQRCTRKTCRKTSASDQPLSNSPRSETWLASHRGLNFPRLTSLRILQIQEMMMSDAMWPLPSARVRGVSSVRFFLYYPV